MKESIYLIEPSPYFRKIIIENLNNDFFTVDSYFRSIEEVSFFDIKSNYIIIDYSLGFENIKNFITDLMIHNPKKIFITYENTLDGNFTELYKFGVLDFLNKSDLEKEKDSFSLKIFPFKNYNIKPLSPIYGKKIESSNFRLKKEFSLLIIGSSTGGPSALSNIIEKIPANFPIPIVIVQHIASGFTKPMAERFNSLCHLEVKEVEKGEELKKGYIYIAPSDYQTTFYKSEDKYFLNVTKDYSDNLYKPCVDNTIFSATDLFKDKLMISILTGMGEDGRKSCEVAKRNGAYIFAESRSTAVVYGMPRAIIENGLCDEESPIDIMYEKIERILEF